MSSEAPAPPATPPLRALIRASRSEWALFALSAVCLMGLVAAETAGPMLFGVLIDSFLVYGISSGILVLALINIAIATVGRILEFGHLQSIRTAGCRITMNLRNRAYAHLLTRSMGFIDKSTKGQLIARLGDDVTCIGEMFLSDAIAWVGDAARIVLLLCLLLMINVPMTLILAAAVLLLAIAMWFLQRPMRARSRIERELNGELSEHLQTQLAGFEVVQSLGLEERAVKACDELGRKIQFAKLRSLNLMVTPVMLVTAFRRISIACIAWYGAANLLDSSLSVGVVVAFIYYAEKAITPIEKIIFKFGPVQAGFAATERLMKLIEAKDEDAPARDLASERVQSERDLVVEVRNLSFSYDGEANVLEDVDFDVSRGQRVAIVGATGSGKSTLIKLLSRLYDLDTGDIFINGRNILAQSKKKLRSQMTVVSQATALFDGAIADNMRLVRPETEDREIRNVLDQMGAKRLQLGDEVQDLSAGERQLVGLARAMLCDPELLILDEATSNVDSATEAELDRAFDQLLEGRTSIVIAHRLSTIQNADKIFVMVDGRIAEEGTYAELKSKTGGAFAGLDESYWRGQA